MVKVDAKSKNLIDEPIPEINIPILKPALYKFNPKSLKSIASKKTNLVKEKINNFSDWIISYVPKSVFKVIDERVELLKEDIKNIYKDIKINKKERQTQLPEKTLPHFLKKSCKAYLRDKAFKGFLKTYRIDGIKYKKLSNGTFIEDNNNSFNIYDWQVFLFENKKQVIKLIKKQNKPIKLKLVLSCWFENMDAVTQIKSHTIGYFHTKTEDITEATDLNDLFSIAYGNFGEKISKFTKLGSGWYFYKVEYLDIHIDPINPLQGSSYFPLPTYLTNKKALINIKNTKDNECFKWAVTCAIYPQNRNLDR